MDGNDSDEVARRLQDAGQDVSYSPEDLTARLEQVKAQAGRSLQRAAAVSGRSSGDVQGGMGAFGHRLLLAVDAEPYGTTGMVTQRQFQDAFALLGAAADAAGLDRTRWATQDAGDSLLAILPEGTSEAGLVDIFMRQLDASLRDFNHGRVGQLRLRAAVHVGAVAPGANGFVGRGAVEIGRLLDCADLRTALAPGSDACLAVAVSATVFEAVVQPGNTSVRADEFRYVLIEEKEYQGRVWIWVPGIGARSLGVQRDQLLTVGAAVRRRRRELELTLAVVAERTGMSVTFLSQVENGRARPSRSSLEKMAEALRTTAVELLAAGQDEASSGGKAAQRPQESSVLATALGVGTGLYSRQDPVRGETGEARVPGSHGGPGGRALRSVEGTETVGGNDRERITTAEHASTALRYYSVAPGFRLNVRRGPGTNYAIVRVLPEGLRVPILCQTPGTTVTGPYGTSNIWDNIDDGEFVSDAYVNTGSDGYIGPRCS